MEKLPSKHGARIQEKLSLSEIDAFNRNMGLYEQYTQELKLAHEDLGKRVLDVGSDYGHFAIEAKKRGYKDIYSVDLVHPAGRYAVDESLEYGAGKMALSDVAHLPFKDEEFDLLVSFCSMPAVLMLAEGGVEESAEMFRERTKEALLEMLRVTKKGGEVRLGRTIQENNNEPVPFSRYEETQRVLEELRRTLHIEVTMEKISNRSLLIRLKK
jgi:ubiquinone/menaquinone biosynthesis C-methylase UbiE